MTTETPDKLLDRVRKLLAKAEDASVTPPEAEALTAKAAELMAKYGIDRALLAAARPETDAPGSCLVELDNPWKRVKPTILRPQRGHALPVHPAHQRVRAESAHIRLRQRHPVHPQPGFSRASRRTSARMLRRVAGRPVLPHADWAAQRRRTMSRCQRAIVSG